MLADLNCPENPDMVSEIYGPLLVTKHIYPFHYLFMIWTSTYLTNIWDWVFNASKRMVPVALCTNQWRKVWNFTYLIGTKFHITKERSRWHICSHYNRVQSPYYMYFFLYLRLHFLYTLIKSG